MNQRNWVVKMAFLPYVRGVMNHIRKLLERQVCVYIFSINTEDPIVPAIGTGHQGSAFLKWYIQGALIGKTISTL